MTASPLSLRPLLIGAVALALLTQGGCSWMRSKLNMDAKYEDSVQSRPLEVPPGLDMPSTAGGIVVPEVRGNAGAAAGIERVPTVDAPSSAGVAGVDSFLIADTLDSAWRRIGLALGKIDGATVGERAQLLNSYEVTYQGTTMLIRAEAVDGQTRVVALGASGQPITSGPATQLLALLKARLG